MSSPEPPPPDECANCGAAIPRKVRACPGCGADERTGWRENDATRYDGLDLPDAAFTDDATASTADGARRRPLRTGLAWYWFVVAALLVVSLVLSLVSFR